MGTHGSLTLSELAPLVVASCEKCGRLRRYHREKLIERFGSEHTAVELLTVIAQEAGCLRASADRFSDRCGIHYLGPRMPKAR